MFKMISRQASNSGQSARTDQNILTAAKGGGIVFVGSLFEYSSRFVIGFLLARFLGAEQLGLYNLALTAVTVAAALSCIGLRSAVVRYVSQAVSKRDEAALWETLLVGLGVTAVGGFVMAGGLFALARPISYQLFKEPRLLPLLQLISFLVPFLALNDILAAATRGFKKMQYTVVAQSIVQPVGRLLLLIILAIVGLNAAGALTVYSLTMVAVFFLLLYFLNKLFSLKRPVHLTRDGVLEMLRFSLPIYMSDLIQKFGGNVQTVLLGAMNTVATVGIFSVAAQVNLIGQMFHQAIVTTSMPIVSELYGHDKREQMKRYYRTMTKWTFMVNMPLFLILTLFSKTILSIFGQSFVEGSVALTLLAWGNLINAATGICGVYLDMSGNTKLKLVNSIVSFVLVLGLNFLLIPRWGLIGAASTSLIAGTVVNLLRLVQVFVLFKMLPYDWNFTKPIVAGLAAFVFAWATNRLFPSGKNLVYSAMNVLVLCAAYAGTILLLKLSEEDLAVLERLYVRIKAVASKREWKLGM
ncbi:MAG: flippase [Anaerolineae bacterium]|nr:flippase [Anaerolineae bacterium]